MTNIRYKIYFATPMYGGMCTGEYKQSCVELQRLCAECKIDIFYGDLGNESLVQRGRNTLVKKFLDTDATHLFFCDADTVFKAIDVLRLIETGKDIIGGLYPKKKINWANIKKAILANPNISESDLEAFAGEFVFDLVDKTIPFNVDQPSEIKNIGTGFLCIKREVIQKFVDTFPEIAYHNKNEQMYAIFDCGIKDDEYLSEDYWFCNKARELGYKIYTLPNVVLSHIGTYKFTGSIPAMMKALGPRK